jgi:hypothetical protein
MGLLDFLFRRPTGPASPPASDVPMLTVLAGGGEFALAVVGESFYRGNFERLCGRTPDGVDNFAVTAVLVCESDNAHHSEAVRIDIGGLAVGHLTRAKARTYRARLGDHGLGNGPWACQGVIRGGWDRGGDDRGDYGIWLDLDLRKHRASKPS